MAMKMGTYEIVVGEGETELVLNVNQLIVRGWRPLGGPVAFLRKDGTQALLQAMIKSDAPSP